jgi:hypothetical protein
MTHESPPLRVSSQLISMPRAVPDWPGQVLEYVFLLGATLWLGIHASTALLTAPLIARSAEPTFEIIKLLIWLLEALGYTSTVVSGILLLTTLGMHLLKLRTQTAVLVQLGLVLFMTVAAIVPQLWIVPKLSSLLRLASLAPEATGGAGSDALVITTTGLGTMGLLHLLFGSILVAMATRRCYRYPRSEEPQLSVCERP